ncbi:uncharacterized protein LOC111915537 [Lactuca sativa]|uniref:uncharacterized protein LOC111915537 n=1 Tax=Lactuca sativa TaxID=4236 RepID=UPI000CD8C428|nr:uncharacterized protein LOC111915537 [Lactuca sativa]
MITNGDFLIRKVAYVKGLQHNLISVSQLVVGTGLKVSFADEGSEIIEKQSKKVLLKSERKGEMYPLNLNPIRGKPSICLLSKKSDATPKLKTFIKKVEVQLRKTMRNIISDNGLEFKNNDFESFLADKGITHNFSALYTPQPNGIVERRNRSLCEEARTMLSFASLPLYFWADAKAKNSEANAANNKIDNLKKVIDEDAKEMESKPSKSTGGLSSYDSPSNGLKFKGESSTTPKATEVSFEGENPIPSPTNKNPGEGESIDLIPPNNSPIEGENPTPTEDANFDAATGYTSPVEGEKENATAEGEDDQSEFEVEVNAELDPTYDPNYPLLVEPKTVNAALDHSDWVQAMRDELYEFERN